VEHLESADATAPIQAAIFIETTPYANTAIS